MIACSDWKVSLFPECWRHCPISLSFSGDVPPLLFPLTVIIVKNESWMVPDRYLRNCHHHFIG